jgi:hypothetical protein
MSGARKLHTKNMVLSAFVLVSSLFLIVARVHSAAGDSEITIEDPPYFPATVLWYLEPYVTLNVSALHGVDTVVLSYTTNRTDTWKNITMTTVPGIVIPNGYTYEAQLPSQPQSTLLTFVVIANDTLGNYAVKNNTAICYIDYEIPEFPVPSFILVTILTLTVAVMLRYAFRRNRFSENGSLR